MSRDYYVLHYTAVIHGKAYYSCPGEDKIKHFIDGSSDIEWNLESVERIEEGEVEFLYSDEDEDERGEPVTVSLDDEFPF